MRNEFTFLSLLFCCACSCISIPNPIDSNIYLSTTNSNIHLNPEGYSPFISDNFIMVETSLSKRQTLLGLRYSTIVNIPNRKVKTTWDKNIKNKKAVVKIIIALPNTFIPLKSLEALP